MLGFRVWDNEEKRFINSDSFVTSDSGMLAKLIPPGGVYCDENRFIPMQLTGLKDRKDNSIFEGDILLAPSYADGDPFKYLIVSDAMDFIWACGEFTLGSCGLKKIDYEIIGNIYENDELVEKLHC